MANNCVLVLVSLLIFPSLSCGQSEGQRIGQRVHPRTMANFTQILLSKNRFIKHDDQMDEEATYYPDCFYHKTILAMNIEKGKTRTDNIGIMISGQETAISMENIVETWVHNTDFIEKIRNSTVFGCAFNSSCPNQKTVLSCAFDNPTPQTLRPPIGTTGGSIFTRSPLPAQLTKPYALTPDMIQDILGQLKSAHPSMRYDDDFFMDLGSASFWKCPFPYAQSPHYIVGKGGVERSKQDDFGVLLELGKGVPYHDGKMREAMKDFARRWSSFKFDRFVPTKFGCSVDPDCNGDMILLCAFYPIEPSNWPPNRNPARFIREARDINMTIIARKYFNLLNDWRLQGECLARLTCNQSSHETHQRTFSAAINKDIELLTGSTKSTNQLETDVEVIVKEMMKHKFHHPHRFECCYIPRCQQLVVANCVFAEM